MAVRIPRLYPPTPPEEIESRLEILGAVDCLGVSFHWAKHKDSASTLALVAAEYHKACAAMQQPGADQGHEALQFMSQVGALLQ